MPESKEEQPIDKETIPEKEELKPDTEEEAKRNIPNSSIPISRTLPSSLHGTRLFLEFKDEDQNIL